MRTADQLRLAVGLLGALRSQYWSAAHIARWQEQKLVDMMRHAVTQVPFYRDLGIEASTLCSAADLRRFPVLRKADIQRAGTRLIADGLDAARLHSSRTSGSSGEPTTTWFDAEAWLQGKYVLKLRRLLVRSGMAPGQRVLVVSESRPEELAALRRAAPRGGRLYRQEFVSIHSPMTEQLRALREFRPTSLYAFPSWLAELLDLARSAGEALPRVAVVYTSSEVLTAGLRDRIEVAFGASVCDVYGSTEFKEIAWQCRAGRYHVNFESVWIEDLPEQEAGALVISTLANRAMPLLRFELGDRARAASGACDCGRASPALAAIEGREADVIELPGGGRLSPYVLTTAIERDDAVIQYRIVECAPARFRVEIVASSSRTAVTDTALCRELSQIAGPGTRFDVVRLPKLDRARSGKRSVFTPAGCEP
jgi:phenylacetate-CoA ligase